MRKQMRYSGILTQSGLKATLSYALPPGEWGSGKQDALSVIISIFKEDKVFSMTANLPYGPPVNTDIDYYQTLFYSDFFL